MENLLKVRVYEFTLIIGKFGQSQSSDITMTPEGNTKIITRISDKPNLIDIFFLFPGLGDIPFVV